MSLHWKSKYTVVLLSNFLFLKFKLLNYSRNEDQCLADGLEYPLNYILEEFIKNNIELLLNEKLCWISERIISDLYIVRKNFYLFIY